MGLETYSVGLSAEAAGLPRGTLARISHRGVLEEVDAAAEAWLPGVGGRN